MNDAISLRDRLAADILGELTEKARKLDRPDVECMLLVIADRLFDPQLDAAGLAVVCSAPASADAAFCRLVGSTPRQLIATTRVRVACRLLDHTALLIGRIAEVLGFSSPDTFRRTFRRIEGQAPLAYRIAHMGQKTLLTPESVSAPTASARRAPGAEDARSSAPSFSH